MGETVEIPKDLAAHIRSRKWFRLYLNLEDFVLEAVRLHKRSWIEGE